MKKRTQISMGFATTGQGAGPMMVTWKSGLFEKYGMEVAEPRLMGGAKGVVRGLASGDIQFGNMAAPAPLRATLKGEADLVFLTGGINQQFLMARPGLTAREQLNGKKIGFVGDGGINDALVNIVVAKFTTAGVTGLQKEKIPPHRDQQLQALVSGQCDAIVVTPPDTVTAQRNGCHYLIDFAEYGLNYGLGGIAARRAYIVAHPDITENFIKAYVAGMYRYRSDREFTIAVQAEYSGISDRTIAAETYDLTRPGMPLIPYPVIPALQTLLDFMALETPEAKNADARRFVDDGFLRELENSGFVASLNRSPTGK